MRFLNLDWLLMKSFKELKIALPKGHPSLSTLTRWINQVKREVDDLKDKHRIGRRHLPKRAMPTLFSLFFRTSGVVHISDLDKGKTKDYQTYIKDC